MCAPVLAVLPGLGVCASPGCPSSVCVPVLAVLPACVCQFSRTGCVCQSRKGFFHSPTKKYQENTADAADQHGLVEPAAVAEEADQRGLVLAAVAQENPSVSKDGKDACQPSGGAGALDESANRLNALLHGRGQTKPERLGAAPKSGMKRPSSSGKPTLRRPAASLGAKTSKTKKPKQTKQKSQAKTTKKSKTQKKPSSKKMTRTCVYSRAYHQAQGGSAAYGHPYTMPCPQIDSCSSQ